MTLLELLNNIGERRAARAQRPRDIRQFIGFMFLAGYYVMVYQFTQGELPEKNVDLIRDAMLTLGPPVGLIIGAMFRSDAREEQATENTGAALRAIRAVAAAGATPNTTTTTTTVEPTLHAEPQPVEVVNQPEKPIPTTEEPRQPAGFGRDRER